MHAITDWGGGGKELWRKHSCMLKFKKNKQKVCISLSFLKCPNDYTLDIWGV
jgi:hypothetical protein